MRFAHSAKCLPSLSMKITPFCSSSMSVVKKGPRNKAEPRHSGSAKAQAQEAKQTEQRHFSLRKAPLAAA